MSATIDERVVSMQFDNKQFESNVQTSLGTIEKLKQSLNFSGASKGLENVSSAAKSCDMSYLGNAVETVKLRFSALEVMAVTALSNITNSAVNAGKRLVSAFTIDPIKSGFQEYETQINAVQTILANTESKGTTLTDVNNALDTLNTYADKTIYNFTEMTRNIGTFTAAGVDLDTSVNAIQGIANLAAVSGSTSQQASTAMYQLSQALASGTVKLQDWNSVVNAGMGGQVFQDALKETARVHGVKIDEMIKKQGSFRETLSEGWLSSEILTETLQKFTLTTEGLTDAQIQQNREMLKNKGYTDEQIDAIFKLGDTATNAATKVKTFTQLMDTLKEAAQSGWTQTWELLVGDFEEAKELWTSVSDIFGGMIADSAEARNTMLEGALLSNWDQMINKINKAGVDTETFNKTLEQTLTDHGYNVDELVEKYGSLENAFKAGAVSTSMLKAAITNLKIPGLIGDCIDLVNNIDKLGGRELLIESLKNAFEGLMSIVKPIKEAFREVFPPMTSEQLYSFIEGLRDLTAKFKLNDDQAQKLKDTFKGLFNALKIIANFFISIGKGAISLLGNFSGLGDGILTVTSSLGNWLTKLKESSENANIFGKAVDGIVNFVQSAINALKNFASAIKLDFKVPGFESFLSVLTNIWNFIQKIGSKIAGLGTAIGQNLSKMFTVDNIKEALNIANSGLLAGVLLAIKNFFGKLGKSAEDGLGLFDKLKGIADNITEVFDTLGSSLKTWQQSLKADILIKIAGAIGILALSILAIASVEPDRLASSLGAISVLFGDLMGSLAIFGKMDSNLKGVSKAVGIMIGMSFAILILASALKKLASLSWEEIAKGLVGIAGLMGELMLAMLAMSNMNGSAMKGATQIVIFALAIKILASACKDLSSLSWEELGKGLAGVGGLLAEISIFLRTAKFGGKAISTALGIAILSGAIKILASACKDFGAMSWMEIGKGLASIGGLLLELAAFTRLTGNAKNVVSTGLALVLIGASMKIFASAVKDFSKMSWDELGRGLLAMAGALAAVTLALRFMPKNTLSIGTGLVVVSAALMILANVMPKMGGMSWDEIGKGLATLGGAIVILSIGLNAMNGTLAGSASLIVAALSLAILTPVLKTLGAMSWESIAKGLITIAGAFAIIGIAGLVLEPVIPAILGLAGAMALIGVGVLALGAGLVVAAAGITALSLAIAAGATSIVAGLSVIITGFIGLIPAIITGICDGIAASITSIGNALKALVLVGIDVLVSCIPAIVDGILKLVSEVLASLAGYTPQIVDSLLQFVISVVNGLAIRMPELIQAALNLLASFFAGITEAFASMDTSTLINAGIGIGIVAAIMGLCSLLAPIIPTAMAGVLGAGAVIAELALVLAAIGALAQIPGLDWLVGEGGALLESIGNAIGGFVGGIVGGVLEGISNSLPAVATNLSTFMTNLQPFIDGAQQLDPSMLEGVNSLVGIITAITAANLLESITSFITGGSSITTFGAQLVPFGQAIADFASVVTGINTEAITSAAVAAQGLAEVANAIPAEGGIIQKFSGEQDLSSFGTQLVSFGQGMKSFADSVVGIDTAAIAAAAVAAQGLAEVANAIPAEGGIIQKFSGEQNLSSFGTQLVSFGQGIKSFADSVAGIDTAAITAAATASQSLATLASNIPAEGGIIQKFTGEQSLENFGTQIGAFGAGMKAFSDNVAGIDVASVTAATEAGVKLSEMANSIPDQGGFISWFTGAQDLTNFGTQVTKFGEGIKGYADAVAGIDVSSVNSATAAAVSLGSMASSLPEGESIDKVKWLGEKLKGLGEGIKDFSDQVTGINVEASNSAISVVRSVSSMARFLPDAEAIDKVKWLGEKLKGLGSGIKDFATEVSGVDTSSLSSATTEIGHLSKMLSRMSGMDFSSAESFSGALKKLSKTSVDDFIKAFTNAKSKVTAAIKGFIDNAASGIESNTKSMTKASEDLVTKCVSALKDGQSKFRSAGKYLVEGFANGISSNTFMAEAKAKAMAGAAIEAAKEALKEHSPSKVFYGIGAFAGKGFVNAFSDYEPISYKAGGSIAESAVNGLRKAITNVQDVIENGIDSQPTIRPVLDLSNVAAGSDYIRDMLDMNPSLGTMKNIRSISSNMNRNQNGANDDVISAIRDLGHKIESTPSNSYTVNGITYDDGSNISDAVKTLIRAARVERRI